MLNTSWTDAQRNLIAIHLQSTNINGLTIPPLRAGYMIQYRNNLIGKHFKTLMQTLPFHVHGLVTPTQFTLIKAVSVLSPLLWVHEIPNMEEYLVRFASFCGWLEDIHEYSLARCWNSGWKCSWCLRWWRPSKNHHQDQASSPCTYHWRYPKIWSANSQLDRGFWGFQCHLSALFHLEQPSSTKSRYRTQIFLHGSTKTHAQWRLLER